MHRRSSNLNLLTEPACWWRQHTWCRHIQCGCAAAASTLSLSTHCAATASTCPLTACALAVCTNSAHSRDSNGPESLIAGMDQNPETSFSSLCRAVRDPAAVVTWGARKCQPLRGVLVWHCQLLQFHLATRSIGEQPTRQRANLVCFGDSFTLLQLFCQPKGAKAVVTQVQLQFPARHATYRQLAQDVTRPRTTSQPTKVA
jgi:hypothetical protein